MRVVGRSTDSDSERDNRAGGSGTAAGLFGGELWELGYLWRFIRRSDPVVVEGQIVTGEYSESTMS
jgi:hypothetical protein